MSARRGENRQKKNKAKKVKIMDCFLFYTTVTAERLWRQHLERYVSSFIISIT